MAGKDTKTIDTDLYDGLQQARKKKPRYFALITKGTEVVGMIVQKKVISDGMAQKAKAECKGSLVIQGICQGEGVDLKLEVTGREPSVSPKKIKDFIAEHTELTLKPFWTVVTKLSGVEDEEAPPAAASGTPDAPAGETPVVNAPPVETPTANTPTVNTPSPGNEPPAAPPQPPVDGKALQVRLKKLLERNKELVGNNPALRETLQPLAKTAADLVIKGSADGAEALDKLERALGAAGSGGQPSSPAQQQWQAEFARIEPRLAKVLQGNPPEATKLRAVMAYATEQADLGAHDKALAALKRLEPLLSAAPQSSGPGQLDPARVQAAAAEIASVLERQSGVMQEALDLAGEIEQASADLERMSAALASSLEDEGEEEEGEEEIEAAADFLARVLDVQAQAASLPDPAKKALQKRVRELQVALAGGAADSLAADVDALENELARANGAARTSEASKASGDRVNYRRLVLEWRAAQADSRKQLDQFVAAFLSDQEVQADPRFAQISVMASQIAAQMPMFGSDLDDALAEIDDAADDAARAKARTEAQKILAAYSKALDGAEGLHELQALADDEFGGISFVSELQRSLDKLGAQLASAA